MLKVIITRGISGSGKSHWAKEQLATNPGGIVIVCKDDIRGMLWNGDYSKGREDLVKSTRNQIILNALREDKHVIVADTNFDNHEQDIREVVKLFCEQTGKEVHIEVKSFEHVPLALCIERDAQRPNPLGEKVIRTQYNKWIVKSWAPMEQDRALEKAIIVDIDNTLTSSMNGRSPYDWMLVKQDSTREAVVNTARIYQKAGYKIIILSGRDAVCKNLTEEWLQENSIPFDALFMRDKDDCRKDSVVKEELFYKNVFNKWYIEFVLDDRLSVCRLWHSLGLTLYRVGDPDSDF